MARIRVTNDPKKTRVVVHALPGAGRPSLGSTFVHDEPTVPEEPTLGPNVSAWVQELLAETDETEPVASYDDVASTEDELDDDAFIESLLEAELEPDVAETVNTDTEMEGME